MKINKKNILYLLLGALVLLSIISMFLGPVFISPEYLLKSEILWQIRIPRIILSAMVGIMLGISGVILQGILRNPLADPYILGEEMAFTLGVDVEKIRLIMIIMASLMTAAAVSVSGLIGFVGLIIPHFVRLFLGPNHKTLVPVSALGGAILMMGADTIGRTVFSPIEIPIGVVMALIGSPFFLYILRRRYRVKR